MVDCIKCSNYQKNFLVRNFSYPNSVTAGDILKINFELYNNTPNTGDVFVQVYDTVNDVCIKQTEVYTIDGYNSEWIVIKITMPEQDLDLEIAAVTEGCEDSEQIYIISDPADEGIICAKSNIEDGVVYVEDENENVVLEVEGTESDCVETPTGDYCAYWESVEGYEKPDYQCKTLTAGEVINFNGEYKKITPDNGVVCAHSNIEHGAVTVEDESENEILNVIGTTKKCTETPVGEYCAYWIEVDGYTKPSYQCKILTEGETITFYGEYTAISPDQGEICAHSNIKEGIVSVEDESENEVLKAYGTGKTCKTVNVGDYTAYWQTVKGYIKPSYQSKTLNKDESITFYGEYIKESEPPAPEENDLFLIIILIIILILAYIML